MFTAEAMREYLLAQYEGSKDWPNRVKAMSDKQVFAIYMRLTNIKKPTA